MSTLDLEFAKRKAARTSFEAWFRMVRPTFKIWPHTRAIIQHLERVNLGEIRNLLVVVPPRSGKSTLITETFSSWWLGNHPTAELMCASATAALAEGFSRTSRRFLTEFGRQVFGVEMSEEAKGQESWELKQGGKAHFLGRDGTATGRGAGLLLIDDFVKNVEEARSEEIQRAVWDTYREVFATRLSIDPPAPTIVVGTRFSEIDFIARLLEDEKNGGATWHKLILPVYDDSEHDLADVPEELILRPWTRKELTERRKKIGPSGFESLYMCRPSDPKGTVFPRAKVRHYQEPPPKVDRVMISADLSFGTTSGRGDPVAIHVWGRKGPDAYLLDRIHGRLSFHESVNAIKQLRARWPQTSAVLVEKAANGFAAVESLKREMPGVIAVSPEGGKLSRAYAVQGLWHAGNILLPSPARAPWILQVIEELVGFPEGAKHDDDVDAASKCLPRLMQGGGSWWAGMDGPSIPRPGQPHDGLGDGWNAPDHRDDRGSLSRRGWFV